MKTTIHYNATLDGVTTQKKVTIETENDITEILDEMYYMDGMKDNDGAVIETFALENDILGYLTKSEGEENEYFLELSILGELD